MSVGFRAGLRTRWSSLRYRLQVLKHLHGRHPRLCPLCGRTSRFAAHGLPPRYDARCGHCGSLERHRLLALAIDREALIPHQAHILHFAPEQAVAEILRSHAQDYISADLVAGRAELTLDLHALDLEPESFDVVVISHVLEHVDDRRALPELYRILRPRGRMIVMVPIVEGWAATYETSVATDPEGRTLHYGQHDHLRFYGRDLRDRIRAAGFALSEFVASGEDSARYGLVRGETVFVADKA